MNSGIMLLAVGGAWRRSCAPGCGILFSPQQVMVCKIPQRLTRRVWIGTRLTFAGFGAGARRDSVRVGKMRKVCGDFYRELAAAGRV